MILQTGRALRRPLYGLPAVMSVPRRIMQHSVRFLIAHSACTVFVGREFLVSYDKSPICIVTINSSLRFGRQRVPIRYSSCELLGMPFSGRTRRAQHARRCTRVLHAFARREDRRGNDFLMLLLSPVTASAPYMTSRSIPMTLTHAHNCQMTRIGLRDAEGVP